MAGRLLLMLAIALACGPAWAQDDDAKKQASEHFARAEVAEQAGDWQTAYEEYERAYNLVPHPDVLYNMASMSERLGEIQRAAELYQRYLDESETRPADAPKVEQIIAQLENQLAARAPPEPHPVRSRTTNPYGSEAAGVAQPRIDSTASVKTSPATPYVWRIGASYGLGAGDVPVERYRVVGSYAAVDLGLQAEVAVGLMGRNDIGIGAGGRYWLAFGRWRPFIRVMGTVGYASKDAASDSGSKIPISVETGLGVAWAGPKGEIYVTAGPRFSFGGVGEDDTLSDSHINDTLAATIDFALVFGSADNSVEPLISTRR